MGSEDRNDQQSIIPSVLSKLQKWGDYSSMGEPVSPSTFIPMKTPLSTEILRSWSLSSPPKNNLTVPMLINEQKKRGRSVGMILDLTNHDCLYESDLVNTSIKYEHIQLVAKEFPPLDNVREIVKAAKDFWAEHPDEHIAIHCAYGFNRTGFVLCSYLIQEHGMTVDQALTSFAAARPPGVKHEKFKNELRRRYDPNYIPHSMPPPTHIAPLTGLETPGDVSPAHPSTPEHTSTPSSCLDSHRDSAVSIPSGTPAHTRIPILIGKAVLGTHRQTTEPMPQSPPTAAGGSPNTSMFLDNESLGVNERMVLASLRDAEHGQSAGAVTSIPSPLKQVARKGLRDLQWAESPVTPAALQQTA